MMKRGILTTNARTFLREQNIPMALLTTATDLEHLLFLKLVYEGRIKEEKICHCTLKQLLRKCFDLELIPENWKKVLYNFAELRNILVHKRGMLDRVTQDYESIQKLKQIVLQVLYFVDVIKIEYSDNSLEAEYGAFLKRIDDELAEVMKQIRSA